MRLVLSCSLLLLSCSSGSADDDGTPQPGACGVAGQTPAMECTGIDQCGGPNNAIQPSFCEHCAMRPDTHLCEAGSCRMFGAKGTINTAFSVPSAAVGTKSYTIAIIHPTLADGSKATCEKLMSSGCRLPNNPGINTSNSTFKNFGAPATIDAAYPGQSSAEAGSGRILFIQVTTDVQGKGMVKARGCVENITVVADQTIEVPIEIEPI